MHRFILSIAFGLAASSVHAADWDRFLQAVFGAAAAKDGSVCYARVYDAGHLAANKTQRIRDVAIKLTLRTENGERRLDHNLVVHLVGSRQKYWSGGQCGDYRGLVARCFVEGDGGAADFALDGDGKTLTAHFDHFNIWRPRDAADETTMTFDKSPADKVAKLTKAPMSACAGMGD